MGVKPSVLLGLNASRIVPSAPRRASFTPKLNWNYADDSGQLG
jgi:hypothetical protein